PACDVALGGDEVSRSDVVHSRADLDDRAGELVPDRYRRLDPVRRPRIPVEDVEIGSAYARRLDVHEYLVVADARDRDLVQDESRLARHLSKCPGRGHGSMIVPGRQNDIRRRCGFTAAVFPQAKYLP